MPLHRELTLYLMLLSMELLAAFSPLVALGAPRVTAAGYGVFWLLLLGSISGALATRATAPMGHRKFVRHALVLAVALGICGTLTNAVAGGRSSVIISGLLLGIAYWRGTVVTQDVPSHDDVQRRFVYGYGLLFLGIVWIMVWGIALDHFLWQMLASVGIAYTLAGMVALALARLESSSEPGVAATVGVSVALLLGGVAIVSVAALQIFALDIVGWSSRILHPVSAMLGGVLGPGVQMLLTPLFWLVALVHRRATPPRDHNSSSPSHHHSQKAAPHHGYGDISPTIEVALAALVTLLILALLWRAISSPRTRQDRGVPASTEGRQTIGSPFEWLSLLVAWLRGIFSRGRTAAVIGARQLSERVLGPSYSDDPVRRSYTRMLRRAQGKGIAREKGVTPLEFQERLQSRWPEGSSDFAALTQAYMLRRYGEMEIPINEAEAVDMCWRRLRTVMRQ